MMLTKCSEGKTTEESMAESDTGKEDEFHEQFIPIYNDLVKKASTHGITELVTIRDQLVGVFSRRLPTPARIAVLPQMWIDSEKPDAGKEERERLVKELTEHYLITEEDENQIRLFILDLLIWDYLTGRPLVPFENLEESDKKQLLAEGRKRAGRRRDMDKPAVIINILEALLAWVSDESNRGAGYVFWESFTASRITGIRPGSAYQKVDRILRGLRNEWSIEFPDFDCYHPDTFFNIRDHLEEAMKEINQRQESIKESRKSRE